MAYLAKRWLKALCIGQESMSTSLKNVRCIHKTRFATFYDFGVYPIAENYSAFSFVRGNLETCSEPSRNFYTVMCRKIWGFLRTIAWNLTKYNENYEQSSLSVMSDNWSVKSVTPIEQTTWLAIYGGTPPLNVLWTFYVPTKKKALSSGQKHPIMSLSMYDRENSPSRSELYQGLGKSRPWCLVRYYYPTWTLMVSCYILTCADNLSYIGKE